METAACHMHESITGAEIAKLQDLLIYYIGFLKILQALIFPRSLAFVGYF